MLRKLEIWMLSSLLLAHATGLLVSAFSAPAASARRVTTVSVRSARCTEDGRTVQIQFDSGLTYDFHSMWLRDACRDENSVVAGAGERRLTSTPVGPLSHVDPEQLRAVSVEVQDNDVVVSWNDASPNVRESRFPMRLLQQYAPIVGKVVVSGNEDEKDDKEEWSSSSENIPKWLEPYTGYPDARAPNPSEIRLWTNHDGPQFSRFHHSTVMTDNAKLLELLERLFEDGVVLVDNVPGDTSDQAQELQTFISHALGGLQKDPTRSEPNWKIVAKKDAASISYDPVKRLYQHTDSSIPPHGIPGLVLSMHYVKGYGANTLTDGYAVAQAIRQQDPEAFQLLATYGYDGERDFAASRVDSTQNIAKGLIIRRKHPIFHTDPNGDLLRIQYNEVFRMPLTLDYNVFPKWYAAFSKFVSMIHSEEYQRTVPMEENTILLMNNWRVLHGRAGNRASPDRHLVGGTIVREAVYSRAMQLARLVYNKN